MNYRPVVHVFPFNVPLKIQEAFEPPKAYVGLYIETSGHPEMSEMRSGRDLMAKMGSQ